MTYKGNEKMENREKSTGYTITNNDVFFNRFQELVHALSGWQIFNIDKSISMIIFFSRYYRIHPKQQVPISRKTWGSEQFL